MSRLIHPLALAFLLTGGGCATLGPAPPPDRDAAVRLDAGLAALLAGHHNQAFDELAWVMTHCPDREAGLHARIALVALELDPRNPTGRPEVGTQLVSDLILDTGTPDWLRPLTEATYLLALGLGAPAPGGVATAAMDDTMAAPVEEPVEEPVRAATPEAAAPVVVVADEPTLPVHGCGPILEPAHRTRASLPVLPGPSLARMLAATESELDAAEARVINLEAELATLRRELQATRAELDRIRRTLRP